nr:hypothetical protein [Tanacetum cinerariifolium]
SGQAPAMAPPVRTDEQILPHIRWVPIGKSNCYLDLEKSQGNLIYKIAVDLLKNTNFFRAFTASSTIPSIYIHQFWDTLQYDKKAGSYRCQLDEQWFVLTKHTLREALQITPINNNQPFVAPSSSDALINFVNELGYPKLVRNVSNFVTNDMFQPWRALITIINLCLIEKTSGFERPRAPMLQILWGIVKRANIDYAERIWEEFTQSIHTFIEDKRNYSRHTTRKKKATLIVIPSIRFTKLIIHHLQRRHRFHPINLCLTGKTFGFERPRAPVLLILWGVITRPHIDYAERIWEEFTQSIHTFLEDNQNLSRHTTGKKKSTLIVIPSIRFTKLIIHHLQRRHMFHPRPDSPLHLPNEEPVLGYLKFSAKGTKREVFGMPIPGSDQDSPAPKPIKPAKKPMSTVPKAPPRPSVSTPVTSAQPAPTSAPAKPQEKKRKQDTETSDKPPKAKKSNLRLKMFLLWNHRLLLKMLIYKRLRGKHENHQLDEGFTATAYPKVQENLKLTVEEHVLLEDPASSSGTLSSLQHLSKDISFGDLFFSDKPSKADNDKATAETEVESMVSMTIQQDMSSIPPMTSPIIDHQQFKATTTKTTTTTTTTLPPPSAQQQSTA